MMADNLHSAYEHPLILRQKIQKELELGRIAGPFNTKPFANLVASPLGLVDKKEPGE